MQWRKRINSKADKNKTAVDAVNRRRSYADKLNHRKISSKEEIEKQQINKQSQQIRSWSEPQKQPEGTDAVAAVNPVGRQTKATSDATLRKRQNDRRWRDKLSDTEKSAAKEETKKTTDRS